MLLMPRARKRRCSRLCSIGILFSDILIPRVLVMKAAKRAKLSGVSCRISVVSGGGVGKMDMTVMIRREFFSNSRQKTGWFNGSSGSVVLELAVPCVTAGGSIVVERNGDCSGFAVASRGHGGWFGRRFHRGIFSRSGDGRGSRRGTDLEEGDRTLELLGLRGEFLGGRGHLFSG